MTEQMFYIWSWEHNAWWALNERGYVEKKENAGIYSFDRATKICIGANYTFNHGIGKIMPNEAMVPIF